jgi:hypothetical protein
MKRANIKKAARKQAMLRAGSSAGRNANQLLKSLFMRLP